MVMSVLPEDVPAHLLDMRLANRERSVAALPVKLLVYLSLRLDPLGRTPLHLVDDLSDRAILRQHEECVNVIDDATDLQNWTIMFTENACHVGS